MQTLERATIVFALEQLRSIKCTKIIPQHAHTIVHSQTEQPEQFC